MKKTVITIVDAPVVSTLEMEFDPERASGNSTRQVNFAIQNLFEGNTVKVQDHYHSGQCRQANLVLFNNILRRLNSEHTLDRLISQGKIRIEPAILEIELV